jgi:hypothetical protein
MKRTLTVGMILVLCLSGAALAGANYRSAKASLHVLPHASRSCTENLPVITGCEDIMTTEPGTDVDVFPVFYDLVEYKGFDYGLTWPGAYSCTFTSCSPLVIGGIVNPGDGVAHAWYTCQQGPVAVPGWGRIQDSGTISFVPYPGEDTVNVGDCLGILDDVCVTSHAGIGGASGGDPCGVVECPELCSIEAVAVGEFAPEALVCPLGEGDSVTVTVTVVDCLGAPLSGLEVEIFADPEAGLCFCPGERVQATTNAEGVAVVGFRRFGGCGFVSWYADASYGCGLTIGPSDPVFIVSYDCGVYNCVVDLVDFIFFCGQYQTTEPCCDFNNDGFVNLSDLILFAEHYYHTCP